MDALPLISTASTGPRSLLAFSCGRKRSYVGQLWRRTVGLRHPCAQNEARSLVPERNSVPKRGRVFVYCVLGRECWGKTYKLETESSQSVQYVFAHYRFDVVA